MAWCVLFAKVSEEPHQCPDVNPCTSCASVRVVAVNECRACYVEMNPWVVGEMLKELAGVDSATELASSVLYVGDIRLYEFAVFFPERKPHYAFMHFFARGLYHIEEVACVLLHDGGGVRAKGV